MTDDLRLALAGVPEGARPLVIAWLLGQADIFGNGPFSRLLAAVAFELDAQATDELGIIAAAEVALSRPPADPTEGPVDPGGRRGGIVSYDADLNLIEVRRDVSPDA